MSGQRDEEDDEYDEEEEEEEWETMPIEDAQPVEEDAASSVPVDIISHIEQNDNDDTISEVSQLQLHIHFTHFYQ